MSSPFSAHDEMDDDPADGLLSPHDLADLIASTVACPTSASSAFSGPGSAALEAECSTGSKALPCRGAMAFRAEGLRMEDDNWKVVTFCKFLAADQRRSPDLPGSFDAWLSAADSYGCGGRLERGAADESPRQLPRVDSSDSDCALPQGSDQLISMGSRSSIGSSVTTLSNAASCALSSAANSGDNLAALARASSLGAPQPPALPSLMTNLPFDCLPDMDDSAWPGFDSGACSPQSLRESHSFDMAGDSAKPGRPCCREPVVEDVRSHGAQYFVSACNSDWAVDASCFWVLPGSDGSLVDGRSGRGGNAALDALLGFKPQPHSEGLPRPASRSVLTAKLTSDRSPLEAFPQPFSVLRCEATLPQGFPSLASTSPTFEEPLQASQPWRSSGGSSGLPAVRRCPRRTMSGMLQIPKAEDAGPTRAEHSVTARDQWPVAAEPRTPELHDTRARAGSAALLLAAEMAADTLQAKQAPALAVAPAVFETGGCVVDPATGLAVSPSTTRRCTSHGSLLDEKVHGGRPRHGHGGLELEDLVASGWLVDDCTSSRSNSGSSGNISYSCSIGLSAPSGLPRVPSPVLVTDLTARPGEPRAAYHGSSDQRVRASSSFSDASASDGDGEAVGRCSVQNTIPATTLTAALISCSSEDAEGARRGNPMSQLSKGDLAALQAIPSWALFLVLTQRLMRRCTRMQVAAVRFALVPWTSLMLFTQRLLFCLAAAFGRRLVS